MNDETPKPPPADAPPATAPVMRRICCVAAPRRQAPSVADQLRAAAVWAQIIRGAAAAREQAQGELDDEQ